MNYSLQHIRHAFSRQAKEYDTYAGLQQDVLSETWRCLRRHVKRDATLLDAGCGTGYLLEVLRGCDVPFKVIGCDIAQGMCEKTRQRSSANHPCQVVCGDINALPLKDAAVDAVISSLAMQWIADKKAALSELYRVLKPGGWCVLSSFGPTTLQELRFAFEEVDDMPHVSEFPPIETLCDNVATSGFAIESTRTEFRNRMYMDVQELMQELRAIGATNKLSTRRNALTGRRRFMTMEKIYREYYETDLGLPASWEVLYLLLRKKA